MKNSKTKNVIIVIAVIFFAILIAFGIMKLIPWLFSAQYNENGISHFLVITIDKNQEKEYIGKLENHDVYVEGLQIDETNFRSVDAKNVSIKEAIDNKLVSIDEWRKYAWRVKKDGNIEILRFENYEIVISNSECVIRMIK